MAKIRDEEYTFVTNNRTDFAALMAGKGSTPDWSSSFRTLFHRGSVNSSEPRWLTLATGI
jgi:hypothetical protein